MRSLRGKLRILSSWLLAAGLILVCAAPAPVSIAQETQRRPAPPPGFPQPPANDEERNPILRKLEEKQAVKRSAQRQQELVKDTDKLVALVNELKSEVDKSDKDMLSVAVVKKAEEIEKLARSVKDKMKAQ